MATLIGYWKLDESSGLIASDSSPNLLDGNLTNMVGDEWTAGQFNNCVELKGIDDYVNITDNSLLNPSSFSISLWAKADNNGVTNYLVTKGFGTNSGFAFWLRFNQKIAFQYGVATGFGLEETDFLWTAGVWYHLVVTLTTAGVVKLYVNSVLNKTSAALGTIVHDDDPLRFGTQHNLDSFFVGKIDEIRYFNGVLNQNEIHNLYLYNSLQSPLSNINNDLIDIDFEDLF